MKTLILLLPFAIFFFSNCQGPSYEYAVNFYKTHQEILNIVLQQMEKKKFYTDIEIRGDNAFDKIFSTNLSGNVRIFVKKREEKYKYIIEIDTVIEITQVEKFSNNFFCKYYPEATLNDEQDFTKIINFMIVNDIGNIIMPSPVYSQISISIGTEVGIEYRITGAIRYSFLHSEQIEGNWYYVKHKPL